MPRGSNKGHPLSADQEWAIIDAFQEGHFIRHICRIQKRGLKTVLRVLDGAGLRDREDGDGVAV